MLKILKLQFNTKRRKYFPSMYQYLGYTVGDNVGLWLGKGYSISSDILRSWVRKSDDTGDKNKWQLLTSNSHLIIDTSRLILFLGFKNIVLGKCLPCVWKQVNGQMSLLSKHQPHSFRHFKMYWHRECHVPTNLSPLEPQAVPDQSKI